MAIEESLAEVFERQTLLREILPGQLLFFGARGALEREVVGRLELAVEVAFALFVDAGGEGLGLLVHEVAVEEREGLEGVGGDGADGAGADGVGLIKVRQHWETDGAFVEEIDRFSIDLAAVFGKGPEVVGLGFGEDDVVDFLLDGRLDGRTEGFGVELAGGLEDGVPEGFAFHAALVHAPVEFVVAVDGGFGFVDFGGLAVGGGGP
jgi:hypothetical protein